MKTKTVNKLSCNEVAKYVCENLDEYLNSRECRAIRKHLQTCPKCTKQLDSLKKTVILYRNCPDSRYFSTSPQEVDGWFVIDDSEGIIPTYNYNTLAQFLFLIILFLLSEPFLPNSASYH